VIGVPKITCAVCSKPVDRILVYRDLYCRLTAIRVFCHGEEDDMELTDEFVSEIGPRELAQLQQTGGLAFTTKKIPSQGQEVER